MRWVDDLGRILSGISSPFNPYLVWKMNRLKFPINSYEIYFIAMLTSVISYVMVSYLTCRAPFKLKQMLHREDAIDETVGLRPICALKIFFAKLTGVTPEYSCGDKIIAWSCFGYSFLYRFCIAFAAIIVFNIFSMVTLIVEGLFFYGISACSRNHRNNCCFLVWNRRNHGFTQDVPRIEKSNCRSQGQRYGG